MRDTQAQFVTEDYVLYGTNEYNFEKLSNPLAYEPTKCSQRELNRCLTLGPYSETGILLIVGEGFFELFETRTARS